MGLLEDERFLTFPQKCLSEDLDEEEKLQNNYSSNCLVSLQGLLALEGELTPILVQMVKSANMNGLLDSDSDSLTDCQQKVKARLHEIMQKDQELTQDDYQKVCGQPAMVK